MECARNFEIFGEPGLFFEEALTIRFMTAQQKRFITAQRNVFRNHGWRGSGGVFVVGLLHIFFQVFIVNISKLLKF